MIFFVGLDDVHFARHFTRCFISVNRLVRRRSPFEVQDWILDSGAFTQISRRGDYHEPPAVYAGQVRRWAACGNLQAAVTQDYMCEPDILLAVGRSVADHQRLTITRYDALLEGIGQWLMPVLQGWAPADYLRHLDQYGSRIGPGRWVGVGSVCRRNSSPRDVAEILYGLSHERPDLRFHGFGLKTTALRVAFIRDLLYSSDSMAWSYAARREGRSAHDWREAQRFASRIDRGDGQIPLLW